MASSRFSVDGLAELDKLLKSLPVRIEKNVLKGALRAGQKVMLQGAKSHLNEVTKRDSGALENSLRIRFARRSEGYGWVRSYLVAGDRHAFYSHMVEFGTASFYSGSGETVGAPYVIAPKVKKSLFFGGQARKAVVHPGIKPKPFMRPALDEQAESSIRAMTEYLRRRIPKELQKAGV